MANVLPWIGDELASGLDGLTRRRVKANYYVSSIRVNGSFVKIFLNYPVVPAASVIPSEDLAATLISMPEISTGSSKVAFL